MWRGRVKVTALVPSLVSLVPTCRLLSPPALSYTFSRDFISLKLIENLASEFGLQWSCDISRSSWEECPVSKVYLDSSVAALCCCQHHRAGCHWEIPGKSRARVAALLAVQLGPAYLRENWGSQTLAVPQSTIHHSRHSHTDTRWLTDLTFRTSYFIQNVEWNQQTPPVTPQKEIVFPFSII